MHPSPTSRGTVKPLSSAFVLFSCSQTDPSSVLLGRSGDAAAPSPSGSLGWQDVGMRARTLLAATHPGLLSEFVEVVGRPGHLVDVLGTSSNLPVRWNYSLCGNRWVATTASRTSGSGCPRCAWSQRAASHARAPRGKSLAELQPRIAAEFVANLTRPASGPLQLRPGSHQRCVWRCETCAEEWVATVANRGQGRGCPDCANESRRVHQRQIRSGSPSAANNAPHLVRELVENLTTPSVLLDQLNPGSGDRCRWQCAACQYEWEATVANRVKAGSGCPRSGGGCGRCGRAV